MPAYPGKMAILCSSRSYPVLTNKQSWPAKGHFTTLFQVHHNTAWGRSTLKTNTTMKSLWCWKNSLTPWANYYVKHIFHIMSPAWLISTSHSPLGALESNRNMQGSALSPEDCFCLLSQETETVSCGKTAVQCCEWQPQPSGQNCHQLSAPLAHQSELMASQPWDDHIGNNTRHTLRKQFLHSPTVTHS